MGSFTPTVEQENSSPEGAFEAYQAYHDASTPDMVRGYAVDFPDYTSFDFAHKYREGYIDRYGFAIPNTDAIQLIRSEVSGSKLPFLEMGAGVAYWAYHLKRVGVDIQCYDNFDPCWRWDRPPWVEVKQGSAEVITDPCHILLIWPPYQEPFGTDVLKAWLATATPECRFFFVGEGWHGCTGDDELFRLIDANLEEEHDCAIPQWNGIRDSLTVYRKK